MDREERIKRHLAYLAQEKADELEKNKSLIKAFIDYCKQFEIDLNSSNFDYQQGLGILCNSKDIVLKINPEITTDKEGLFDFHHLLKTYTKKSFSEGALFADNYIIFANSYYRRGFYENNNFAPRFIDHFWRHDFQENEVSLALDLNRVRIDTEGPILIEEDTWYGANFSENIATIKDGVTNLRPPQYLNEFELDFVFASAFALDVYWYSYEKIKVFQALEFKQPNVTIKIEGNSYFPVRYVHAEYDLDKETFRHFDGAIQFYTEAEYYERRENNFNSKVKGEYQVKSMSKKLFKINGDFSVDDWIKFTSHFFAKNPLILEYFEGKEPDHLVPYLEAFKKEKGIT
ncbi:hypothetical protein N7U66_16765 [Lacinutrix neustonica]|uniref:Uncharacterized protein n=1 Tax=Lacinutrix neustonica TaxID=2980107 RepID=A0A9E8MU97_9FLAO|nr:hypothetical protein [Lacinutrix neustonica]WAC01583.1 hypothetical protein N7U66_16765 [Lacinutrix neustonica]